MIDSNFPARYFRLALSVAVLTAPPLSAQTRGVRFRSISDGMVEARKTGKPALLYFTAAWCAPCQDLKTSFFSLGTVAKLIEERYVPIEVVDRWREDGANRPEVDALQNRMGVRGFPTLVVHRVDGTASLRFTGFASRESTFSFLRQGASRLEAAEEKARRAESK